LLVDFGCSVEVVNDGAQALQAIQQHQAESRFDVVLMDCQMPRMDGFQASQKIRELERGKSERLPIIALTANAVEGDRQRCLQAGMDRYVTKPIDPEQLLASLQEILKKPPTTSPSPRQQVVDTDSFLKRCRGKTALAEKLLLQFEQQVSQQLDALRKSLDEREAAQLRSVAHTIKGTAANLSAESLSQAASELERIDISGGVEQAVTSLGRLADEVHEFLRFVPVVVDELRQMTKVQ
jgi:CheY-like chemotaxis protein